MSFYKAHIAYNFTVSNQAIWFTVISMTPARCNNMYSKFVGVRRRFSDNKEVSSAIAIFIVGLLLNLHACLKLLSHARDARPDVVSHQSLSITCSCLFFIGF